MKSVPSQPITLVQLWREFLPLSLSDVTMACGDPLITTTLAHLPDARNNLAGVGIVYLFQGMLQNPPDQSNFLALYLKVRQAACDISIVGTCVFNHES